MTLPAIYPEERLLCDAIERSWGEGEKRHMNVRVEGDNVYHGATYGMNAYTKL